MKLRYKYRLYPTDQQKHDLARLFGCVRVVWNDALGFCKAAEKKPSYKEISRRLTEVKQTEERAWLREVPRVPLEQSLRDLDVAYKSFFSSCKGKRKGRKVGYPKFKSRKSRQAARFQGNSFSIRGKKLRLSRVGDFRVQWEKDRPLPSAPSSVTVIKEPSDRYFVSFVVEVDRPILPNNEQSVGIDLGITTFATLSTGEKIDAPKPLKTRLNKLRKAQRKLSRKQKGSKRRERQRLRVAKIHAKIKDTRDDFLHKLSTRLIRENQTIVLEDLNVSGMLKNRKLSRAISDLGWYTFRTMLEAKAAMYGRDFQVISRWEPTSQRCSSCKQVGGKKELSVREWTCLFCGETHDRDVNAAINIMVAGGYSETLNGHGGRRNSILLVASDEVSIALAGGQRSGSEPGTEPIQMALF
jgi:putative transposase